MFQSVKEMLKLKFNIVKLNKCHIFVEGNDAKPILNFLNYEIK